MMARVLIVEDNADLAFGLRNNLEIEGHEVAIAADGIAGLDAVNDWRPELVVLDLMRPGQDGYRVLREMRHAGHAMPVLILTSRAEEADKVLGFRLGADDYVTKPFGILELLARVDALLRRSRTPIGPAVMRFGTIEVDQAARTVRRAGHSVSLTKMEFDLLSALLRRRGAVASRLELLAEVWGHSASVLTRTVDTHVAELRRKLEEDPSAPRHILTARKSGYRLVIKPDDA
jgi:two-component system alkaline phosphatase synthesis response regulator PhoP